MLRTGPLSALAALCVVLASGPARADSVLELAGGFMTPLDDGDWTDYVESSPKLALRAGSFGARLGGMLSVDWTPLANDNFGFGDAVDISSNRFRVLMHVASHERFGSNLTLSLRLGVGIDVARVSVETNIFGATSSRSDTDGGLALEGAAGLWFDVGSVQIGGELALPMAFHGDASDDEIDLDDYTSLDLDVLLGVRFRTP